jgi:7-carboxy-7-deazaguanine synthase
MESNQKLKVSEIFYSLQGEGQRVGTPTIFIRLSGCKAKHACFSSGIKCDTEFESGEYMSLKDIDEWCLLNAFLCNEITWTGGEPTDQLTEETILYFKSKGYWQAIETSGLNPTPKGLDYICISPKVAEHVIKKNFDRIIVQELRYVRHKGQSIPEPKIQADHYFISPHSDGFNINTENLNHCIELCKKNPKWRLSLQTHKIINIL